MNNSQSVGQDELKAFCIDGTDSIRSLLKEYLTRVRVRGQKRPEIIRPNPTADLCRLDKKKTLK